MNFILKRSINRRPTLTHWHWENCGISVKVDGYQPLGADYQNNDWINDFIPIQILLLIINL